MAAFFFMKTIRWIVLLLALAPVWLKANDAPRSAKIIAVSGPVSVTTASGTNNGAVGTLVPVGATVKTAADGQATIQFFDGTVVLVQPDTVVGVQAHDVTTDKGATKENTLLDLRVGGVVASLDPAKKDVNNFKVRTPRGVAAARGTVLSVRVQQDSSSTVTTMHGTVTFLTDKGEVTVAFGHVGSEKGVLSVADAVKANPGLAAEILSAASSVASSVGSGSIANTANTPNLIAGVLAALVDVAVQASPDRAADIVRDIVTAAGPALQGDSGARTVELIAKAAELAAARSGNPDSKDIIAAAKESAASAGIAGVFDKSGKSGDPQTILPVIDQTQKIVSPSAP